MVRRHLHAKARTATAAWDCRILAGHVLSRDVTERQRGKQAAARRLHAFVLLLVVLMQDQRELRHQDPDLYSLPVDCARRSRWNSLLLW